jgi:hypothetical protein
MEFGVAESMDRQVELLKDWNLILNRKRIHTPYLYPLPAFSFRSSSLLFLLNFNEAFTDSFLNRKACVTTKDSFRFKKKNQKLFV